MSELPTWEGLLPSMPATILKLLKVDQPDFIPPPIHPVIQNFQDIKRVIMVVIDNLGLFEITYYKPEFLIQKASAFILLSTKNPYTLGVFHQLLFGGFDTKHGFHLLRKLNEAGLSTSFIGRAKDLNRYNGGTNVIPKDSDMSTWIEAAKVINKNSFTLLHFLDFEKLHRQKRATPEELIEKLIKRTDKWLLSLYKQMRSKTLMIVIGNHGRYRLDLEYSGKIAEWRKASVPIAVVAYKQ